MKIVTIVGARPQFIKAATVSRVIQGLDDVAEVLIHTGQHYDPNMSEVFFKEMSIPEPSYDLGVGGGTHGQNTGRMIEKIEETLVYEKPDWVLVYGDTDSTLAGTLAAVKMNISVAHVESGLRSFNRKMPEEINRVLTDHAADLLFTPTVLANQNLEREGISPEKIIMVGDVMFDAMLFYKSLARLPRGLELSVGMPFVVCTVHRAENTGDSSRLRNVVEALNHLSEKITVVFPVHPRTRNAINREAGLDLTENVILLDPLGYLEMVWLLDNCEAVLTDSGGLQKEAFFSKKPCITLRDETEWGELQTIGANALFSPARKLDSEELFRSCLEIKLKISSISATPYGDGAAAEKVVKTLKQRLS